MDCNYLIDLDAGDSGSAEDDGLDRVVRRQLGSARPPIGHDYHDGDDDDNEARKTLCVESEDEEARCWSLFRS
jgi:hypothetical protein